MGRHIGGLQASLGDDVFLAYLQMESIVWLVGTFLQNRRDIGGVCFRVDCIRGDWFFVSDDASKTVGRV